MIPLNHIRSRSLDTYPIVAKTSNCQAPNDAIAPQQIETEACPSRCTVNFDHRSIDIPRLRCPVEDHLPNQSGKWRQRGYLMHPLAGDVETDAVQPGIRLRLENGIAKRARSGITSIGDGECRLEIESKIHELNLNACDVKNLRSDASVVFCSWIKDVENAYPGLDIIALTSLNEGTPVSLIEAQAAGVPIVTIITLTRTHASESRIKSWLLSKQANDMRCVPTNIFNIANEATHDSSH